MINSAPVHSRACHAANRVFTSIRRSAAISATCEGTLPRATLWSSDMQRRQRLTHGYYDIARFNPVPETGLPSVSKGPMLRERIEAAGPNLLYLPLQSRLPTRLNAWPSSRPSCARLPSAPSKAIPEPLLKRVKQLEATGCITRGEPPENLGPLIVNGRSKWARRRGGCSKAPPPR